MKRNFLTILFAYLLCMSLGAKQFTVVIDAGHGGKDPGALGARGREKDINLSVAMQLGKLISDSVAGVDVVYTRDKDVFVPLENRCAIANKANGDLFISVHVNSSKSSVPYGAETYTIGLAKTKANFEVAKRENSVILLEDGYKERYQGFDPSSPESYIMFEFMQSKYNDQSIEMAAYTQDEFVNLKRNDRGVRQENFWVLHQTKMPSVLVELGFISNKDEEKYLLSDKGKTEMATAIYKGFVRYKHEFDKKNTTAALEQQKKATPTTNKKDNADKNGNKHQNSAKPTAATTVAAPDTTKAVYKLQLFAVSQKIDDANDARFKGLSCDYYEEGGAFKYTYGAETDYAAILQRKNDVKKQFPQTFVVAFYKGKKVTLQEAKEINSQK